MVVRIPKGATANFIVRLLESFLKRDKLVSEIAGKLAKAEKRIEQIAEILLGGIYRYSQRKDFISNNSPEETQNGATSMGEELVIEPKPKDRKN